MPRVGDTVSQYRLVRQIGQGGMGVVYEAVHLRIRSKRAAIKLLSPEAAGNPESIARFEREAEAAAAIGHEGIVDIYDLGVSEDGCPFMVMEYLEGESLKDTLKRALEAGSTLDPTLTVFIGCNVLSALSAAHRAGIVHRDLKPDNIFLVRTGSELPRVILLDFGIARMSELGGSDTVGFTLTRTGTIMGTPYFMSPEQALGEKHLVDQRTDLWSLGVILYICLTGQFPFQGDNYNQLVARLVSSYEPPNPRALNPAIPVALEQVILQAMCRDLSRRYASADEMLADLSTLADEATLSVLALSERQMSVAPYPDDFPTTPMNGVPLEIPPTSHNAAVSPLENTTSPAVVQGETPVASRPARRIMPLVLGLVMVALLGFVGGGLLLLRALSSDRAEPGSTTPAPTTPAAQPEPPVKVSEPIPLKAPPAPAPAPAKTAPADGEPRAGIAASQENDEPSPPEPPEEPSEPTPASKAPTSTDTAPDETPREASRPQQAGSDQRAARTRPTPPRPAPEPPRQEPRRANPPEPRPAPPPRDIRPTKLE